MKKCKKIIKTIIKLLNTKIVVVFAMFALIFVGTSISKVNADDNYQFGTVYQYYLLDNRKSDTQKQADNQKITKVMGKIGSGGIAGNFSYDDLVTSAPSGDEGTAKKFCSMMATYSTFRYFTTQVQGFNGMLPLVGRLLVYAILFIPALLLDVLNLMVKALFSIFDLNVIPFLAELLTNLSFSSKLADALQIDKGQIKTIFQAFLTITLSVFLFGIMMMLRHGSRNLDQRYVEKTKGRLINFVFLNVVVVLCATLLNDVNQQLNKADDFKQASSFASYFVDDRAWAYNYNFAPNGKNGSKSDIKPSNKSYVDFNFNPYAYGKDAKGSQRIQDINSSSSFINNGKNGENIFSNSALLLSYGLSDTFNATDYINYKGTQDSENLFGGASGQSFGSYYSYANSMGKNLVDMKHNYNPSGSVASNDGASGPFSKAVDDYKDDKGNLTMSSSTTWRDRFIYGVKDSGSMDGYYGEEPSKEMINNHVGAGSSGNTISDQSMFFVLSTRFNETGGVYSIPAPGRGIKGKMAQYDSDRNTYNVISMVGIPLITVFALLAKPLTVIVILLAIVMAIFSLGIVDMNLRPLSAYFKALFIGDIEYTEAFGVYAIGITGTALTIRIFPQLFQKVIDKTSSIVVNAIPNALNQTPQTPQAALMLGGLSAVVSGTVSAVLFVLFWKSHSFREKVIAFFCITWEWAKTTGNRLELQANPYAQRLSEATKETAKSNPFNRALLRSNEAGESLDETLRKAPKNFMKEVFPNKFKDDKNNPIKENRDSDDPNNPDNQRNSFTPQEIARRGKFDRINKDLQDIQHSPNSNKKSVSDAIRAEDALNKFKAEPTQENLNDAQDKLLALRQRMIDNGVPQEDIDKVDQALKELQNLGVDKNLKVKPFKPVTPNEKGSNDKNGLNQDTKHDSKSDSDKPKSKSSNDDEKKDSPNNDDSKEQPEKPDTKSDDSKTQKKHHKVKTVRTIENETERHIHEKNTNSLNQNTVNKNSENRKNIVSHNQSTSNIEKKNINTINKRLVNETQVRALYSSLGNSANNSQVRDAIRNIQRSNNENDLGKGIKDLRNSIKDLRPSQKRSINQKKMVNTLKNMLK